MLLSVFTRQCGAIGGDFGDPRPCVVAFAFPEVLFGWFVFVDVEANVGSFFLGCVDGMSILADEFLSLSELGGVIDCVPLRPEFVDVELLLSIMS